MDNPGTVLVTGGSGFIGSWCIIELLRRGYDVRTTVRNLSREGEARAAIATQIDPGARLHFCKAELTADAGWQEAVAGCDYVLHVASPVSIAEPKDPDVLIKPARDGARRVVEAAIKAGVKRIVLTSSVAATTKIARGDTLSDESVWTDLGDPAVGAYARSKTLAERAAWDLMKTAPPSTTLATINPSVVLGPVLSKDFSDSVQVVQRLLSGKVPGIPRVGFSVVDVRDLADLHLRAMLDPGAAGQRFIGASHYAWMADMAAILKARMGLEASKVPTRTIPDFVVRLAGLFDGQLRSLGPRLSRKREFSSTKARSVLGWETRSLEETIVDCGRSLVAQQAV